MTIKELKELDNLLIKLAEYLEPLISNETIRAEIGLSIGYVEQTLADAEILVNSVIISIKRNNNEKSLCNK